MLSEPACTTCLVLLGTQPVMQSAQVPTTTMHTFTLSRAASHQTKTRKTITVETAIRVDTDLFTGIGVVTFINV